MSKRRICIDPGHGGNDPGAIGAHGAVEFGLNLGISLRLEAALRSLGFDVTMTRRMDRTLSLSSRARFANRTGADLFVSIHCNAAASAQASGMEVFHYPGSSGGSDAAEAILGAMLAIDPGAHRDRGVKEAGFAVLRLSSMPAVLVECEFLTNPTQALWLMTESAQNGLAIAIANGVQEYYNQSENKEEETMKRKDVRSIRYYEMKDSRFHAVWASSKLRDLVGSHDSVNVEFLNVALDIDLTASPLGYAPSFSVESAGLDVNYGLVRMLVDAFESAES